MKDGRTPPRRLALKHSSNVEDIRSIATRKLPMAVKDFIEGGAEDEITLHRNRDSFQAIELRHRVLTDVSTRYQTTTILGTPVESPLVLAPIGLAALAHPEGERAAARGQASAPVRG